MPRVERACLRNAVEYRDYYKTLGVSRTATPDELKKAFRKLARQYHPDTNKGNKVLEEKFKEVNEAYEVLSDPEKRKLFDRLGSQYQQYTRNGGNPRDFDPEQWSPFGRKAPAGAGGGARAEEADFGDLFSGMFAGQQNVRQPRDFEQAVEITLEESFHGTSRILQKSGQPDLEVKIPRGARTGTKVRVKGQGGRNGRGQAGDLFLVVEVKPHAVYEVKGDDLYRDVPVNAFIAILGGEQTVDTLIGNVVVKIPAGTSSGKLVRLRGRGMPKLNALNEFGDLYLKVMISVPYDLAPEERAAIEAMARRRGAVTS